MKKLIALPIVQWILIHIFRQKWVFFDKHDSRLLEKSNVFRTDGDQSKAGTTILTNRKNWDIIVVCRCLNAPGYLMCDDQFGNRLACLGYKLQANQTFAFREGREPADFFLGVVEAKSEVTISLVFLGYCTSKTLSRAFPEATLL